MPPLASTPLSQRVRRNAALLASMLILNACGTPPETADSRSSDAVLSEADTADFRRAYEPVPMSFPADHGPHDDFRDEWWYITGNLDGPASRRFGFQITFFRHGLVAHPVNRPSHWAGRNVHMAHFTLTDVASQRFQAFERRARGTLGLAGSELGPFRVWLEDWRLESLRGDDWPWRLQVREDGYALDLTLTSAKPMVLEGRDGLSQKSREPGNASYYYSGTRIRAEGTLSFDGQTFPVTGLAWLDREWSTSALADYQLGWDWFSLQLDEGAELMFYRMRHKDGSIGPLSTGAWIDAGGRKTALALDDVELVRLDDWTAPGGVVYPARWRLTVKPLGKRFLVQPAVADQELRVSVRYWEGAVDVLDADQSGRRLGRGYMELTGYARATQKDVSQLGER
ncbi:MAG: lipocalin-like domain-containing protein [Methylomagnum sp.]